jgi:hypothetical protein
MFILYTQSLDRHTKQLIKLDLQDQHNVLCHGYKNAKSLMEANGFYVTICCLGLSSRVASKASVHELANWFNFLHFNVKQWGGFMVNVSILPTNFLSLPFLLI